MSNVFSTRVLPSAGSSGIRNAGIELTEWMEKRNVENNELVRICAGYDALISVGHDRIDSLFLEKCNHLKVIAQMAVGYDNIDIPAASALRIPVGNTPGVLSEATAETAFLLMISVARRSFYMHERIIHGQWGFYEPTANLGITLKEKTLGIFGLGKIGFEMARLCRDAYHMNVVYCNRTANLLAENILGATRVSFEELLMQSDVLSVHATLTPETKGLFNRTAFHKMKKTAIFINTSRGAVHNEQDLIIALQENEIGGCGLDVTDPEPMPASSPLLYMYNAAVLPHIGSATEDARNAMAVLTAENVIAGLHNKPLPNVVNPEVYRL